MSLLILLIASKLIEESLRNHCDELEEALDYSVKEGIAQLFAVRLISQSVSLTCGGIIDEFMTDLRTIQDVAKIKEHYELFLDCLSSLDGACRDICSRLTAEWNIIQQKIEEGEPQTCMQKILIAH